MEVGNPGIRLRGDPGGFQVVPEQVGGMFGQL
jgi:hypothetical protein